MGSMAVSAPVGLKAQLFFCLFFHHPPKSLLFHGSAECDRTKSPQSGTAEVIELRCCSVRFGSGVESSLWDVEEALCFHGKC